MLYDRVASRLLGGLMRRLGARDVAEDVLQDVFFTVWRKADQFDASRGSAMSWLLTISRRKAIDRIRLVKREPVGLVDDLARTAAPAGPRGLDGHAELRLSMRRCLGDLPDDLHQTVRLCYDFGLTHAELADVLDIPLGTAKGRVRRSIEQLRRCMEVA